MITEDRSRIKTVAQNEYFSVEAVYGMIPLDIRLHMQRVAGYCEIMTRVIERDAAFINSIEREFYPHAKTVFKFHDIGYAFVPPEEINKNEIVKEHVILADKAFDKIVYKRLNERMERHARDCARYHHENFDGSGYPLGLKGEEIPLVARICAIADMYDRLVMEKPYNIYERNDEIMETISRESGRMFQPKLVDIFLNCDERLKSQNIINGIRKE
ncbi:MAG: HD-GYP domain-containing protein [Butyrivibrio sp.]